MPYSNTVLPPVPDLMLTQDLHAPDFFVSKNARGIMSGMPVARTWNALTHDNSGIKLEIVRLVFKTTRSSFRSKEFNELLSSGNNEGQPEYSPPPDDRPTLVVEGGPNAGVTVTLTASHTTLGRHADNDVVFDEALVSRRHAVIIETGSGFFIRDLESTNGTFLK